MPDSASVAFRIAEAMSRSVLMPFDAAMNWHRYLHCENVLSSRGLDTTGVTLWKCLDARLESSFRDLAAGSRALWVEVVAFRAFRV